MNRVVRKFLLVVLLVGVLLTSCDVTSSDVEEKRTTGTVTIKMEESDTSKSILPSSPKVNGYTITLTNLSNESSTYTNNFVSDSNIVFENVLIGSYNIAVNAYSDENYENLVATGAAQMTVNPTDENTVTVNLNWIDGYGSFSVDINWNELTNEDNIIYKAIGNESLGFLAYDVKNKKAFNDADIQWVTDFNKENYTYRQNNIPTEKGNRSTEILFRIYSKIDGHNQVIAETFNCYVTIFANIESVPDGNESFSISNDNIIAYLRNVTDVNASLNEEDSASKIDISWSYPSLSDGKYVLTTWITNNSDKQTVETKTINYSVSDNVVTGDKSVTFSDLDPKYQYTVHFINKTNDENLVYSYSAEITPIDDIRTKVKVQSIDFENGFSSTYVMGASTDIGAVITPTDATYQNYTVSAANGVDVNGKHVTFPTSGDYEITLTSEDEHAISRTVSRTVTVRLTAPTELKVERTNDGVNLSWNSVESATGYTIEKKYGSSTETLTTAETSYLDTNITTGVNYTYSVKATREGGSKFDSDFSEEITAKLPNKVINIVLPEDVERASFASLVEDAIKDQYVTDTQGITINLDASGDFFNNASYSWTLNGTALTGTTSLSIESSTKGLYVNSYESTNTLMLSVTKGDYTYSASSTFHYITAEPGKVTITGDDTVKYNEPIQLTATAEVGSPIIVWSSSDTAVATVSSTGVVTAVDDGTVIITATVVSTGESSSKEITSHIPVTSIKFTSIPHWLMIKKNGVSISDSSYLSVDLKNYIEVKRADGKTVANTNLPWVVSNNNNSISINNGVVSTVENGSGGNPRVEVTIDGVSAYVDIPVYSFDIKYGGKAITGNSNVSMDSGTAIKQKDNIIYVAINDEVLSSSSNSTLKNLATYDWNCSRTGGTVSSNYTRFSNNNYDATLSLSADAAEYTITVTIKVHDAEIAKMSFTRKP